MKKSVMLPISGSDNCFNKTLNRKDGDKMGRKNGYYKKNLHQQAYEALTGMIAFGDSKKADKEYDRNHDTEIVAGKIYSFQTYRTYWKHIKFYLSWLKKHHPECRTLKKSKKYVSEWLQSRVDDGLSAWTIQTEAAALNKLYGIHKDDPDRFQPPQRRKEDIKRSRGEKKRDKHFSEIKNEELINFCKCCGFRRNVLEKLKGSDFCEKEKVKEMLKEAKVKQDEKMIRACSDALENFPDQQYFILHRSDKGGKTRLSPIIGDHVADVVRRMQSTPPESRVWQYVPGGCDVHGYRADYATTLYRLYARPIDQLQYSRKIKCADGKERSEVYICRGDEAGRKLDRKAIRKISIALGHNREDTAIANYIRNL